MPIPTVRLTIGRLMVLILLAGLAIWAVLLIGPMLVPSLPEQQAEAAYKLARSRRGDTHYAVLMYRQESESTAFRESLYQKALTSFDATRSTPQEARTFAENQVNSEIARTLRRLESDAEAARVAEQAAKATFERERARRLRGLGF